MIIVYTVTATEEEAERIGRLALERHLCACINLVPGMRSMFWWEGRLEQARECILLLKTGAEQYPALEKLVRETHSYDVPSIFSVPVEQVSPEYQAWLQNALK